MPGHSVETDEPDSKIMRFTKKNMTDNTHTHIVIMAGGIGSRLWPLSTPEHPKQFIDVLGTGKSLLQMTVERFLPVCDIERFWVVTSERYAGMVAEQLPQMPREHILQEPVARNTAPCIAYASWKIYAEDPEANIVVTPSDALVTGVRTLLLPVLTLLWRLSARHCHIRRRENG